MSTLSTHVLDTARGRPAEGIRVTLERASGEVVIGSGITNADGRVPELVPPSSTLAAGTYQLRFAVAEYFAATRRETFFPEIIVLFRMDDDGHYHVPLLLSPFGYSTYRGS